MKPFIKWAGGKRQLLEKLERHIPESYNRYYEPFIGGGAFLLHIQPEHAVINDTNQQLLNAYKSLKQDAEEVIEIIGRLDAVPCDKNWYLFLRDRYNAKISSNELDAECAALMIWINKHCFNGLYRVNTKGLFNVPYNNKTNGVSADADNLRLIGKYLKEKDIEIRMGDFEDCCFDAVEGDFVYFDSPYVPESETAKFTEYTKSGFSINEHKRLANLAKKMAKKGIKVMLSNNDVPLVYEMYSEFHIEKLDARRSINNNGTKRVGKEVIIYSL